MEGNNTAKRIAGALGGPAHVGGGKREGETRKRDGPRNSVHKEKDAKKEKEKRKDGLEEFRTFGQL